MVAKFVGLLGVGDAHVFPGFLTPELTQLSFQSHQLLFSHASAEVRGENTPERKFASIGYRTHNHQIMSLTCLKLSHPGGSKAGGRQMTESNMDPLTLPAQLKTETVSCRPKRRLKHYIGIAIKIIVIRLQFS